MSVPAGVIVAWPGAASGIPSGWSRVTSLDSRFVKGAAAAQEPDETGGAATHTHTSPAHSHTGLSAHTHAGGTTGPPTTAVMYLGSSGNNYPVNGHTHSLSTSGAASGSTTGSTAQGINDVSDSQPPFRTVLFIHLQVRLDITVTAPEAEGTVSAPAFDVAWDAEVDGSPVTQNDYRVRIYDDAQGEVLYDSGTIASATQEHTMSTWAAANNTAYSLVVDVTDADNVSGSSSFHEFSTSWTPPATITGLTVTPVGGAP